MHYVHKKGRCGPEIATFRTKTLHFLRVIQGVHKVRVHFKKIITLIVFAIEIICKKDLKEENRYFLRFY